MKKKAYNFKDLTGKRFGKWFIESFSHNGGTKRKQPFWNCICDCGAKKLVGSNSIRNGSRSCLHCRKTIKLREYTEEQAYVHVGRNIYARYRCDARSRNFNFNLTFQEFLGFLDKPCFYCGVVKSSYQQKRRLKIYYNGIDRVDNEIGYELDNCVTCCKRCNTRKRSVDKNMILKIYNFLKQKGSI